MTAVLSLTQRQVACLHFFPLIGARCFLRARLSPWPVSVFLCTELSPTLDIYTNLTANWWDLISALLSAVCFPDLGLDRHLTSLYYLLLQGKGSLCPELSSAQASSLNSSGDSAHVLECFSFPHSGSQVILSTQG